MVPQQYAGQPNLYVVHAWSMPFCEMVRQLVHALAPSTHRLAAAGGSQQRSQLARSEEATHATQQVCSLTLVDVGGQREGEVLQCAQVLQGSSKQSKL